MCSQGCGAVDDRGNPDDVHPVYSGKPTLPEYFVVRDCSFADMLETLMRWYDSVTPPLRREISYVVFPKSADSQRILMESPGKDKEAPFNDSEREMVRKTVDVSALSIEAAFEKIANAFGASVFCCNGVYHIRPLEE
jgi:hypothetical protein